MRVPSLSIIHTHHPFYSSCRHAYHSPGLNAVRHLLALSELPGEVFGIHDGTASDSGRSAGTTAHPLQFTILRDTRPFDLTSTERI
ncbi:hypothetical protein BD413DRAFT_509130 [Trametes elegans]|nr:hypothetical protein BD413DRAFT_509130 [Trametes elegans]